MPGFELIGVEEKNAVARVFDEANGILFRYGFPQQRNNSYQVADFEQQFAQKMSCKHALAVSSGSTALRVALAALDIKPGDEVITQAFTFVATVEAIVESGAVPVVVDIDETLNMCPLSLKKAISSKTKAIIPVHMFGTPANLNAILEIAGAADIPVVEDTAWGCGASYNGKMLGTIGAMGTFSFDYAKTITTGEGGMVITNNSELDARGRAYHDHGHENNPSLPRWEDSRKSSGFNYRMMEIQGAIGKEQLKKLDAVLKGQRELYHRLSGKLKNIAGLTLRPCPPGGEPSYDALVFFAPSKDKSLACRERLLTRGISTKVLPEAVTWHFAKTWTHIHQMMECPKNAGSDWLKKSQAILERCVALPLNLKAPADYVEKAEAGIREALSQA